MDRKIACDAAVTAVAFSAPGDAIHALCSDSKLRSYDSASGALRRTIALEAGDTNPVLTPSGVTVVAKDGSIKSWDAATGQSSRRPAPASPRSRRSAVSSDGRLVASNVLPNPKASETLVRVLDAAGKEKFSVPSGLGGVGAIAISPDGNAVVAASYDADVRAWNARNGELLRLIEELPVSMFDLRFSPDGKWLAAAGAAPEIYIYDTKSWRMARKISGLPELVGAIGFSGDGRRLASGGFHEITVKKAVSVIVWDFASGKPVRTVEAPHAVTGVALSPDGRLAAVAAREKSIELWQLPA